MPVIRTVYHKSKSISFLGHKIWNALWVIHKVCTLGGGRGGPVTSVLARMGGGEGSAVSVRTPYSFFAGSLQNINKIKEVSYSDNQNYPLASPLYS